MGKLTKKIKCRIAVIAVLALITAALTGYNIYLAAVNRQQALKLAAEQAELEEEKARLEELRIKMAGELKEYYPCYRDIKGEFIEEVEGLSEELQGEIVNMAQLKEITSARLDAAIDYRNKFTALDTPGPLETFYQYELEYIGSDIKTIKEVLLYYGSGSYSTYDDGGIGELYGKTELAHRKAQEEFRSVYSQYGLEYLPEEF
jgi:hypothetical protein